MTRDLGRLGADHADVLIVGGGIHGLFAAYDAASRGLRVVLIERDDFGAGLSFNHQRTIHGGLRALQHGAFGKVREQLAERRMWTRLAPHLIRPLPFVIGTYGLGTRSRLALRVGLSAYDAIGSDRNVGVPEGLKLPASGVLSRVETEAAFPGIDTRGLTGGARWYDYQARHPDRLNGLIAQAASHAGAALFNYVECLAPMRTGERITGARVRIWPSGEEREIEAATTVLCAGAGLPDLHQRFGLTGSVPLIRAMNLILDRPALPAAIAAPGRSGRMLTCVPWQGYSLVGTFQSDAIVEAPEDRPPTDVVTTMLDDVRTAFPHLDADRASIRVVHHGLTPARVTRGRADLLPESQLVTHVSQGIYSLVGVKFTTARLAAATAIDAVCAALHRSSTSHTSNVTLPAGTAEGTAAAIDARCRGARLALDAETRRHLVDWYGTEAPDVIDHAVATNLAFPLTPGSSVLAGEIAYALEHGAAVRLADAVLRRTNLGATGHPGHASLEAAANIMATRCHWS
ncbi:MAG: FAD-dependent oxidoreductase, partial [Acidobacteriota bacterium]